MEISAKTQFCGKLICCGCRKSGQKQGKKVFKANRFQVVQKLSKAFKSNSTEMQGCVTKSEHKVPQLLRSRSDLITTTRRRSQRATVVSC